MVSTRSADLVYPLLGKPIDMSTAIQAFKMYLLRSQLDLDQR